jgi:hypothetical protein
MDSTDTKLFLRNRRYDNIIGTLETVRELKKRAQQNVHNLKDAQGQVRAVHIDNSNNVSKVCRAVTQSNDEVDICIMKLMRFYQQTEHIELQMVNELQLEQSSQ